LVLWRPLGQNSALRTPGELQRSGTLSTPGRGARLCKVSAKQRRLDRDPTVEKRRWQSGARLLRVRCFGHQQASEAREPAQRIAGFSAPSDSGAPRPQQAERLFSTPPDRGFIHGPRPSAFMVLRFGPFIEKVASLSGRIRYEAFIGRSFCVALFAPYGPEKWDRIGAGAAQARLEAELDRSGAFRGLRPGWNSRGWMCDTASRRLDRSKHHCSHPCPAPGAF